MVQSASSARAPHLAEPLPMPAEAPHWMPRLLPQQGPHYLAIVEALAQDIAAGHVPQGSRLLPQREMAQRLGLAVGTVAKAYAEAERRGLVTGAVGRGTFVNLPPAASSRGTVAQLPARLPLRPLDMGLNAPPLEDEAAVLAEAMAAVARSGAIAALTGYLPHAGLPAHRADFAAWIAAVSGLALPVEQVMLCNGAQHAIAVAMMAAQPQGVQSLGVQAPGGVLLTEAVTFPGIVGLAEKLGHRLHGVAIDAEGLVPEALDAAFTETGARLLYCMPTLQTPTGTVMPLARRRAIAAVLRRHEALAIEDDVYAFLAPGTPPLAALAPERVFYVDSLAKCVAPGLRIGALGVPPAFCARASAALRSTGWMASPLTAAIGSHLLRGGEVARLAARKREIAAERWNLAREVLGSVLPPPTPPAFHLWLPLARPPAELVAEAAGRGVVLALPTEAPGAPPPRGLRLCLGALERTADLREALAVLAAILDRGSERALV
ncbi:PLP-dependent aminotransferase family protein [Roseomonas sp. E05]|uniref:aminotransferase-like domain-containing protein n=1 Tax=Roseomonas sp. E05 TaxID=3046310 RepID=UPI0024B99EBB|nr:PLP-dependent aminotransferase family protein [Roseomonas sp. E05]MDJ0391117.1 PLP-dependent aminotransferase family protein [Roseomonas sp. E05]